MSPLTVVILGKNVAKKGFIFFILPLLKYSENSDVFFFFELPKIK